MREILSSPALIGHRNEPIQHKTGVANFGLAVQVAPNRDLQHNWNRPIQDYPGGKPIALNGHDTVRMSF